MFTLDYALDWKSDPQTGLFLQVHPPCQLPGTKQSPRCLPPMFFLVRLQGLPSSSLRGEPRGWSEVASHPDSTHFSLSPGRLGHAPRLGSQASLGKPARQAGSRDRGGWTPGHLLAPPLQEDHPPAPGPPPARPPGSAPLGVPTVADTCRASQPRSRELRATPGAVTRSRCQPAPPPASAGGVYLRLCCSFSFTFLFARGWDSPGSGRPGEPQLTRSLPSIEKPRPGKGARLRCLPPPILQPGVHGGTELGFSALRGEVVVVERAMEFSPKTSYRAPPSSGRIHPFHPTSCRSGRPAHLWETLASDFSFRLR